MNSIVSRQFPSSGRIALAAIAMIGMGASAAMAQDYPGGGGGGPGQVFDQVTGYRCVDNNCTRVYYQEQGVNCICVKDNPNTQRLDQVHLSCQTKAQGQWVACPVTPHYGG